MIRNTLMAGSAAVALLALPGMAMAQDTAALEARIALLEAQLNELKSEIVASRSQQQAVAQDVIRIEQRVAAPPAPTPVSAPADGFRIGNNTLKFGGYVKADFIASNYDGGDPANGDLLRDFYLPGSIPVGGGDESTATDFNARQTRFWLTTDGLLGGHKVATRLEMDF